MSDKKSETEWMANQLLNSGNLEEILQQNQNTFCEKSLDQWIIDKMNSKQLNNGLVIKKSGLSTSYFYELLNGTKKPLRDKCIQLAFGLMLDYEETKIFMQTAGLSPLYAREKREAIIIFCINKKMTIYETDEMLAQLNENTLLKA